MIARPTTRAARRSAFTLLEVLVVVAILVVLAGVSSIFVFRYLEDAKKDKALLDMQAIEKAYKTAALKNGGVEVNYPVDLVPYLEQGQNAFTNPWQSGTYQMRAVPTEVGTRVQFFTIAPDGQEIFWPRQ